MKKAYIEARNNIVTDMYKLPPNVEILDNKHILFNGDIHHINCDTLDNRKDNLIALTKKSTVLHILY